MPTTTTTTDHECGTVTVHEDANIYCECGEWLRRMDADDYASLFDNRED
jgi:hypothetical protein